MTRTKSVTTPKHIRKLEAQLDEYPDERGEILTEIAYAWRRAGEHERAIEVLGQVLALGGEDAAMARVELAENYFEQGRGDEARAELAALQASRPDAGPCQLAGELLEDRGDFAAALTWFNMAVSRLTDKEMASLDDETGWMSYAANVVQGRWRVRRALDLPPDDLDGRIPERPAWIGASHLVDSEQALDALDDDDADPPVEVRPLFWQRDEYPKARNALGDAVDFRDADVDSYCRRLEDAWRKYSDHGVTRVTLVPGRVDDLTAFAERFGGSLADESMRRGYADSLVAAGQTLAWPPPRNSPCWCGSGAKYKKCCGRPG